MINTNFKFGEVLNLAKQIEVDSLKPVFKNVFNNDNGGVVLVAFSAQQNLTEHVAPVDLMVYVLEGEIEFTMNSEINNLKAGDFLLMGA